MGQRGTGRPVPGRVRPGRGDPAGKYRAGPAGPATVMTRSGSSATGKPKPATTRHPPTPCSAGRHREPAAVRIPGRCRARASRPGSGRGEPSASKPPGTARPGRGYLTLPEDAPPRRRGPVPSRQAGRSAAPPVQPPCSPGSLKASHFDIRPYQISSECLIMPDACPGRLGARRGRLWRPLRSRCLRRHAVRGAAAAAFLGGLLSRSRSPRLDRSLRSRRR